MTNEERKKRAEDLAAACADPTREGMAGGLDDGPPAVASGPACPKCAELEELVDLYRQEVIEAAKKNAHQVSINWQLNEKLDHLQKAIQALGEVLVSLKGPKVLVDAPPKGTEEGL